MRFSRLYASTVVMWFASYCYSATLDGWIVEESSGSAVDSAKVIIRRQGQARTLATLETDPDGSFRTPNLEVGEYDIFASKEGYVTSVLHFRITQTHFPPHLFARLTRFGTISGSVLDSDGNPLYNAYVMALPLLRSRSKSTSFVSSDPVRYSAVSSTGQFRLFEIPPGDYNVAVAYGSSTILNTTQGPEAALHRTASDISFYPSNMQPSVFTVRSNSEFTGVDFPPIPTDAAGLVEGQIENNGSDQPIWLTLTRSDAAAVASAQTQSDQRGHFRFSGILPGSYEILASGPVVARGGGKVVLGEHPIFSRTHLEIGNVGDHVALQLKAGVSVYVKLQMPFQVGAASICPRVALATLTPLDDWGTNLTRSFTVTLDRTSRVDDLPKGRYKLAVIDPQHTCFGQLDEVIDLNQSMLAEPIPICLVPPSSVRGRLTFTSPITDVEITLSSLMSDGTPQPSHGGKPRLRVR